MIFMQSTFVLSLVPIDLTKNAHLPSLEAPLAQFWASRLKKKLNKVLQRQI